MASYASSPIWRNRRYIQNAEQQAVRPDRNREGQNHARGGGGLPGKPAHAVAKIAKKSSHRHFKQSCLREVGHDPRRFASDLFQCAVPATGGHSERSASMGSRSEE